MCINVHLIKREKEVTRGVFLWIKQLYSLIMWKDCDHVKALYCPRAPNEENGKDLDGDKAFQKQCICQEVGRYCFVCDSQTAVREDNGGYSEKTKNLNRTRVSLPSVGKSTSPTSTVPNQAPSNRHHVLHEPIHLHRLRPHPHHPSPASLPTHTGPASQDLLRQERRRLPHAIPQHRILPLVLRRET